MKWAERAALIVFILIILAVGSCNYYLDHLRFVKCVNTEAK